MVINLDPKFCTYYPLLFRALNEVPGDVLELGIGIHSTAFLHWLCLDQDRTLFSYESDKDWFDENLRAYGKDWHRMIYVDDWDEAQIERPWGIALVDHTPAERRAIEALRLADYAQVIILHDSQGLAEHHYNYRRNVFPNFEYVAHYVYRGIRPHTAAVSNLRDIRQWARQ